jgi:hypothetical protein
VDFANGFIEVYRDPRSAKGTSQSFLTITDKPVTDVMDQPGEERRLLRGQGSVGAAVQEA